MAKRETGVPAGGPPVSEPLRCAFGRNLRRARQNAGLSTYDVEERTGVRRHHLAQIEAGKSNVTIETMAQLAKVVDHDLQHLLAEPADDIRT